MHTITTRPPTPDEQRQIGRRARPDAASYGFAIIFFALVPAWILGRHGGWLVSFVSADAAVYGQWLGWAVAATIFVIVLRSFVPYERQRRRLALEDQQAQIVQEIHVSDPRVNEISLISDHEPILAFDIGGDKILYLQGQWLRDNCTYDAEPLDDDQFINGLPEPYSFPSTEFTVSRLPNSGEVTGIRVAGKYLAPECEVDALRREYTFRNSELLHGSLDDLAGVLAREHDLRQSRRR